MPKFGLSSLKQLDTVHPLLKELANETIKYFDFTVLEGHRGKEAQNAAFARGDSQKPWPLSNHNKKPSIAMDCAPYPVDWSSKAAAGERFVLMAGHFLCCAKKLGIKIRWGGDWNGDLDTRDEKFRDRPHIELLSTVRQEIL